MTRIGGVGDDDKERLPRRPILGIVEQSHNLDGRERGEGEAS